MDGFRHDYLEKSDNLHHFHELKNEGVSMEYLNNTFVTLTFPSHYSIATGNYEESHGIIANNMYDPDFDEFFSMRTKDPKWWDGAEPIWITARKQNKKVGVYFWPGSEIPFKNDTVNGLPHQYRKYTQSLYEDRVAVMVSWMAVDDFDLGLLYLDEPDHSGHMLGPDNPDLVPVIEKMDRTLGLLVQELKRAGIYDRVNLIVTSDHGMASVNTSDPARVVDLRKYVGDELLKDIVQQGPVAHLIPVDGEGKDQELVEALKNVSHMTVMLKKDIPEEKHYRNHRRVQAVFALADDGYQISRNLTARLEAYDPFLGDHGFDDDNLKMRPFFMARGPAFKTGEMVEPIKNVDIYPLICHLLDIQPSANNGSLVRAMTLLANDTGSGGEGNNGACFYSVDIRLWFVSCMLLLFHFVKN